MKTEECTFQFLRRGSVNVFGGQIPQGATEREKFFKNVDSRSSEMAISEFYQRLFERLVSSLVEFLNMTLFDLLALLSRQVTISVVLALKRLKTSAALLSL